MRESPQYAFPDHRPAHAALKDPDAEAKEISGAFAQGPAGARTPALGQAQSFPEDLERFLVPAVLHLHAWAFGADSVGDGPAENVSSRQIDLRRLGLTIGMAGEGSERALCNRADTPESVLRTVN